MMLFITMALGPACIFYLYVLSRFRLELKRAGGSRGCARRLARAVTFITDSARQGNEDVVHTAGRSEEAAGSRRSIVMFRPEAKGPARRDVA